MQPPVITTPSDPSTGTVTVVTDNDGDRWVSVLGILIWPLLLVVGACLLLVTRRGRYILDSAGGRIGGVSAFGLLDLDFSPAKSADIKRSLDIVFSDYRVQAEREFNGLAKRLRIVELFDALIESESIAGLLVADAKDSYRCTIYVRDLVFREGLYQLVDYRPSGRGAGRGRVFPARYGLIGRAFRAGASQTDRAVPGTPEELVVDWGMTMAEAKRASERGRHSFSCVLIAGEGEGDEAAGGIYIDAECADAFVEGFEDKLVKLVQENGLADAIRGLAYEINQRQVDLGFVSSSGKQ